MAELPDKPFNREETYLASIAGQGVELPACPWSRKEAYLDAINGRLEDLDQEIQDLENNPDVTDIVDTYADLEAYDTSTLTDKDIIRVLNDETHNNESTYYRYSKATDSWTYIGSTGPKGGVQSDWAENDPDDPAYIKNRTHYEEKIATDIARGQDAFSGGTTAVTGYSWEIQQVDDYFLSQEISDFSDGDTIYAKYTYSVDGVEKSGEAKFTVSIEDNKYSLDSDMPLTNPWNGAYAMEFDTNTTFRWPVETADTSATIYLANVTYTKVKQLDAKYIPETGTGVNVVQTTGTSTTDVMSQNAVTGMVYADPSSRVIVRIGARAIADITGQLSVGSEAGVSNQLYAVAVGSTSKPQQYGVAVGASATTNNRGVAIGNQAGYSALGTQTGDGSISLGAYSFASQVGQMDISSSNTSYGYNNSNYRLLTGVYPGQSEHDAATVGQAKGTTFSMAIESSSWTALSSSDPYTYSATVSIPSTTTVGNDSIVELINDQAVLFGTYGFAITDVTGQVVTIASIGQPSADITLKINVRS